MSEAKWVFPPTPCPRCHGYHTEAYHTNAQRGRQYRRCLAPICRGSDGQRVTFSVQGVKAPPPEPPPPKLQCPHCGAGYQRQSNLTKHINREHKGGAS